MTHTDILQQCQWDDLNWATLTVDSALFGQPVEVRFMPDYDSGRVITDRMVTALNDFLALTPADLPHHQAIPVGRRSARLRGNRLRL